jgi:N-acetylglucosaminyldiphosphoundecaprenol N-acetyl-beta-D-mannosaminyltransferase
MSDRKPDGIRDGGMRDDALPREVLVDTIPIHDVTFKETVDFIVRWARDGSGGYVSTPNVDHIVKAHRDPGFRKLVLHARLRIPDGMGVVYGSYITGDRFRGTVTGRLLPEAIIAAAKPDVPTMALLGGRDDAPRKAARRLEAAGGKVVLAIGPPMGFEIGGSADDAVTAQLKEARPQILFVGFGAPKQELWMAAHQADLPNTVMLGIGQTIDVLGGRTVAAPMWMTRVGLEWFYRVLKSPIKHGKRMFVDDPRFFWWMVQQRVRGSRKT